MQEWLIIGAVVVVIVAVVAVVLVLHRRRERRERLQQHFGGEYERQVEGRDSRREAESELSERERFFAEQDLREVSAGDRQRIGDELEEAARRFVEDPGSALSKVDGLITSAMDARGYAFTGNHEREQLLSVAFPERVGGYRDAHAVAEGARDRVTTEDRRQAFLELRGFVEDVLAGREKTPGADT